MPNPAPKSTASADQIDDLLPGRIRTLRERLGLTARQLETLADLPKGTVGRMERGTRRIYANDLFRIALVTGQNFAQFYAPNQDPSEGTGQPEQNRLLEAYGRIADKRIRREVYELIESLADSLADPHKS